MVLPLAGAILAAPIAAQAELGDSLSLVEMNAELDWMLAYIDTSVVPAGAAFNAVGGTRQERDRSQLARFAALQADYQAPVGSAEVAPNVQLSSTWLWTKAKAVVDAFDDRCMYWAQQAGDMSGGVADLSEVERRIRALENGTRRPLRALESGGRVGLRDVQGLIDRANDYIDVVQATLAVDSLPVGSDVDAAAASLSDYIDAFHATMTGLCPQFATSGDIAFDGDTGYAIDCSSGLCEYTLVR
jgi:hypothetical protein